MASLVTENTLFSDDVIESDGNVHFRTPMDVVSIHALIRRLTTIRSELMDAAILLGRTFPDDDGA